MDFNCFKKMKTTEIDKDWVKIMGKSAETRNVVGCCQNDMLKQLLPVLQGGLEACQKSLESYLEGKRNKFPRFYFTSDPVLLKILSQGSDPEQIQDDFEKLFDSISKVQFDAKDKKKIIKIKAVVGTAEEIVDLVQPTSGRRQHRGLAVRPRDGDAVGLCGRSAAPRARTAGTFSRVSV